jgi:tape measure domain-containing protein
VARFTVEVVVSAKGAKKGAADVERSMKRMGKSTSNLKSNLVALRGALGALGLTLAARKIGEFVMAALDATAQMEKATNTLKAVSDTALEASKDFEFLKQTSLSLGIDIRSVARDFALLKASAKNTRLEGEPIKELFTAIARASRVMGNSAAETSSTILAFRQMLSKGRVSAEELRRQLSERLPGAFELAASAIGVTTAQLSDMLKKGQLLAEDLLPKLTKKLEERFGKAVPDAMKSTQAAMERIATVTTLLRKEVGEEMNPALGELSQKLAQLASQENVISFFERLGEKMAWVFKVVTLFLGAVPEAMTVRSTTKGTIFGLLEEVRKGAVPTATDLSIVRSAFDEVARVISVNRVSVRKLLEKFEELAVAGGDSALELTDGFNDAKIGAEFLQQAINVLNKRFADGQGVDLTKNLDGQLVTVQQLIGELVAMKDSLADAETIYQAIAQIMSRVRKETDEVVRSTAQWGKESKQLIDLVTHAQERVELAHELTAEQKAFNALIQGLLTDEEKLAQALAEGELILRAWIDDEEQIAMWLDRIREQFEETDDTMKRITETFRTAMLNAFTDIGVAWVEGVEKMRDVFAKAAVQMGAALGQAIGEAMGGPAGAALGSMIGTIVGAVIGKAISGSEVTQTSIGNTGGVVSESKKFGRDAMFDTFNDVLEQFDMLQHLLGTNVNLLKDFGFILKDNGNVILRFNNTFIGAFADMEHAIGEAMRRALLAADLGGFEEEMSRVLQASVGASAEELISNINLAFLALEGPIDPLMQELRSLSLEYDLQRIQAMALGLETSKLTDAYAQNIQNRRDQITGEVMTERQLREAEAKIFNDWLKMEKQRLQAQIDSIMGQASVAQAMSSLANITGLSQAQIVELMALGVEGFQEAMKIAAVAAGKSAEAVARAWGAVLNIIGEINSIKETLAKLPDPIKFSEIKIKGLGKGIKGLGKAAGSVKDQIRDAKKSIEDFLRNLFVGPLSPLTNREQFNSAQGQFNQALAAAQGGDLEALQSLPGLAQQLLEMAQLFSPALFPMMFDDVTEALADLVGLDLRTLEQQALDESMRHSQQLEAQLVQGEKMQTVMEAQKAVSEAQVFELEKSGATLTGIGGEISAQLSEMRSLNSKFSRFLERV